MREKTRQTSWILRNRFINDFLHLFNLHKNDQKNDTLKPKKFTEGVDEEIDDEEDILDRQHRAVSGQR